MNKTTKEILEEILPDETSWDKNTRELKYDLVITRLHGVREAWFMSLVTFPKLFRFNHLLHLISKRIRQSDWEIGEDDYGNEGWYCQDDGIAWEISCRVDKMCEKVWNSEEWQWENPTEEEILAMNIKPNYVPAKTYKQGAVQPSMF